jgi:hypothetical protein
MKRRILFVNAGGIFVLLLVAVGFAPTKASAQGGPQSILGDLGSKKNGPDDIANSLIAAPPKYGKGEKKEQINSTQLKSKSIKDTTFGGSVLNAGITGAEPKLDEKPHSAPVAKDSHVAEQAAVRKEERSDSSESQVSEKEPTFLDLSATATLAREIDDSEDSLGTQTKAPTARGANSNKVDSAKKDNQTESAAAAATGEKISTSSTAKPSPSKTDREDH